MVPVQSKIWLVGGIEVSHVHRCNLLVIGKMVVVVVVVACLAAGGNVDGGDYDYL